LTILARFACLLSNRNKRKLS